MPLAFETPKAALSGFVSADPGSCLADRRSYYGSSIDYFERLSRIIVLDNPGSHCCANSDALLVDVSFEPRFVA